MHKPKVGIAVGNVPSGKRMIASRKLGDFVAVADGITFGVLDGMAFHTSCNAAWSKNHQLNWARANAAFFRQLSDNLNEWADRVDLGMICQDEQPL